MGRASLGRTRYVLDHDFIPRRTGRLSPLEDGEIITVLLFFSYEKIRF